MARGPVVWTLAVGGAITAAGTSMVIPLLTIYLTDSHSLSLTTAGLVLAMFFGGKLVGHVVGGVAADLKGRRPVMLVSIAGSALASLLAGFANNLWLIAFAVVCYGLLAGGFQPAGTAMISDVVPEEERVSAFSFLRVAHNVGFAVGPALAGLLLLIDGPNPFRTLFVVDALTSAVFALVIALRISESLGERVAQQRVPGQSDRSGRYGLLQVLTDRAFVAFCALWAVIVFVYVQFFSTVGPFLTGEHDVSPQAFATWLSVNAALVVLFQILVTRAAKTLAPGTTILLGSVGQGAGLLVLTFGAGLSMMLISIIVFTVGEMLLAPTGEALATRFAPQRMQGRYMGVFMFAGSVGLALGPLVGGLFVDAGRGNHFLWMTFGVSVVAGFGVKVLIDGHHRQIGQSGEIGHRLAGVAT